MRATTGSYELLWMKKAMPILDDMGDELGAITEHAT